MKTNQETRRRRGRDLEFCDLFGLGAEERCFLAVSLAKKKVS